jgi:adenylosuccinate synthase
MRLATVGKEFGSVTGRPRRCGWFDAAAMKRSVMINGISGLCITKLDVLDGVEQIKIGVGYRYKGEFLDVLPYGAHAVAEAEPVLEEMPGPSLGPYQSRLRCFVMATMPRQGQERRLLQEAQ